MCMRAMRAVGMAEVACCASLRAGAAGGRARQRRVRGGGAPERPRRDVRVDVCGADRAVVVLEHDALQDVVKNVEQLHHGQHELAQVEVVLRRDLRLARARIVLRKQADGRAAVRQRQQLEKMLLPLQVRFGKVGA
jgi:hypothetical protein